MRGWPGLMTSPCHGYSGYSGIRSRASKAFFINSTFTLCPRLEKKISCSYRAIDSKRAYSFIPYLQVQRTSRTIDSLRGPTVNNISNQLLLSLDKGESGWRSSREAQ